MPWQNFSVAMMQFEWKHSLRVLAPRGYITASDATVCCVDAATKRSTHTEAASRYALLVAFQVTCPSTRLQRWPHPKARCIHDIFSKTPCSPAFMTCSPWPHVAQCTTQQQCTESQLKRKTLQRSVQSIARRLQRRRRRCMSNTLSAKRSSLPRQYRCACHPTCSTAVGLKPSCSAAMATPVSCSAALDSISSCTAALGPTQ